MRSDNNNQLARVLAATLVVAILAACTSNGFSSPGGSSGIPKDIVYTDAWDRIHTQGKILIGVNANHSPFAHYNENLLLDGFDIAVMREIGQQIGIQVDFRDFTQQGLEQAIQSGQIDGAIVSAASVNVAMLRLSNTYYLGSDGVLALSSATTITVKTASDIATKRVGVLRGGSYESAVSAQTPADKLVLLDRNEDAVNELQAGRIDIAILDLTSAEVLASKGATRIVGQDVYPLRMVVAMGKGSRALAVQVNAALANMQQTGQIALMAIQYLRIDREALLPTPAPDAQADAPVVSTPFANPADNCNKGMAFVQNLSLDDQNMTDIPVVQPGQAFTKAWRVRNSGTCSWYLSYRLVYEYGNAPEARMSGSILSVDRELKPGETNDVQVGLIAPDKPGIYRGVWQMIDGRSAPFGERLYVIILVPSKPDAIQAAPAATTETDKVLIGIDMNSRPFAYYNENNQPDGFDIAVLREVGRSMGQTVEFHDFPAEGLGQSIQNGQVDIAILPTESDVAGLLSYSSVFYTGEGAIVASEGTQIAPRLTISDMLKLRVGVLAGAIYDYWLARQMPADRLTAYTQLNDLSQAIKQRSVDIGVVDLGVAGTLVSQGLRIVGQGVYPHHLVIAMRPGNSLFLSQMNAILSGMQSDGKIVALAQQYLHIDRIAILPALPASRNAVIPDGVAGADCFSGMAFVATPELAENNPTVIITVQPGTPLTRNWRIRNTGTCVWSTSYRLAYAYGNSPAAKLGGQAITLTTEIQPNQTYDLRLNLITPTAPGDYRGVWQMVDATGRPFGERLYVTVSE